MGRFKGKATGEEKWGYSNKRSTAKGGKGKTAKTGEGGSHYLPKKDAVHSTSWGGGGKRALQKRFDGLRKADLEAEGERRGRQKMFFPHISCQGKRKERHDAEKRR